MGFREDADRMLETANNTIEGLAEELNHLNEGIRELVKRRSTVRKELSDRLNIMGNRLGKLDDIYFNLTRGEEGMPDAPSDSEVNWIKERDTKASGGHY